MLCISKLKTIFATAESTILCKAYMYGKSLWLITLYHNLYLCSSYIEALVCTLATICTMGFCIGMKNRGYLITALNIVIILMFNHRPIHKKSSRVRHELRSSFGSHEYRNALSSMCKLNERRMDLHGLHVRA